jgi:hypothetical protein
LGAIALIPLDKAIGRIKDVFYACYIGDWVVLTKSKTALRKVIKVTHNVLNALHLKLHPSNTYIGKISHGRDISEYQVNEPASTDSYFMDILTCLLAKAAKKNRCPCDHAEV